MRLLCPTCRHEWEEPPPPPGKQILCPECTGLVPAAVVESPSMSAVAAAPTLPPAGSPQIPPPGSATGTREILHPPVEPPPSFAPSYDDAVSSATRSFPPSHGHASDGIRPITPQSGVDDGTGVAGLHTSPTAVAGPAPVGGGRPPAAAPQPAPPVAPAAAQQPTPGVMQHLIGRTVAGYQIMSLLGAGGMGAVFLARQISLDRKVAIKVLPSIYASNPDLLARFTREALSAAQLNHHNVVQVYDVGTFDDVHYICMEYVRGETLGGMVRRDGRLRVDDAAGFILQAARGLEYAHNRGIVHRDIKPDNLMVNDHGIVKVADMGLVKMRGNLAATLGGGASATATDMTAMRPAQRGAARGISELIRREVQNNLTIADVAMGTPAYMSPEQARDASSVDRRSDIYSLGCTLYAVVAGRPPFGGQTSEELISKHISAPIPPLEHVVRGIPDTFTRILERMLEKDPEKRYPSMAEVIRDIEAFLGIGAEKGPYTPREHHVEIIDHERAFYYSADTLKRRRWAILGFQVFLTVTAVSAIVSTQFPLLGGVIGLALLTPVLHFVIDGALTHDWLFRRVRSVFFGMPWKSWLALGGGVVCGLLTLYMLGWLIWWVAFGALGLGLALAYQFGVSRPLRKERSGPIDRTQAMLRELRLRGVSEEMMEDFVCRFCGAEWEEYFEDLFGYEAMVRARGKTAAVDRVAQRKRHATWRDPLVHWLERIEEARRVARERRSIAQAEAIRLRASGVEEAEALRRAEDSATRIISESVRLRAANASAVASADGGSVRHFRKFPIRPKTAFAILRGVLGAIAVFSAVVPFADRLPFSIPAGLVQLMRSTLHTTGFGAHWIVGFAGLLVLTTAFSRRIILPAIGFTGLVLLLFFKPIALLAGNQLNDVVAFYGGGLLVLIGAGSCIFQKLSGSEL